MLQAKENMKYQEQFYQHELGEALILDESADIIIENKPIARWTLTNEEQFTKLNLGTIEDAKVVFISVVQPATI
jgi:hypothetical protein